MKYTNLPTFPFGLSLIHYLLIVLVFDIMLSYVLVQSSTYKQSNLIRGNSACLCVCVCVGVVVSGKGVQRGLCFHWLVL
jgi:hypothetical protein